MRVESTVEEGFRRTGGDQSGRLSSWLRQAENLGLVLASAGMVLLPLVEIVLRSLFRTSFFGSSAIVQQLTLVVGMVGGAVAAREGRLLSLSSAAAFLKGRWKIAAQFFSGSVAAALTSLLAAAGVQFVAAEKASGEILAYGVPLWIFQLLLPLGFAAIAWRLLWHASSNWRGRTAATLLAGAVVALGLWSPIAPAALV